MSGLPGATPQARSGASHRPAQRFTTAGNWWEARQAGERLPEHLFDEEIDMEDMVYAHGQEATL